MVPSAVSKELATPLELFGIANVKRKKKFLTSKYIINIIIIQANQQFIQRHFIKGVLHMYEKLKQLLVEELSVNANDVTPDAELINDLGINSLELADLVLQCEEKFDIEISDNDIHGFVTVGDVADYLEKVAN